MTDEKQTITAADVGTITTADLGLAPVAPSAPKPPTQLAGVHGIAVPIAEAKKLVDWVKVSGLPAFQMFVHEIAQAPAEFNAQEWALRYAVRQAADRGEAVIMAAYKEWHTLKGKWPGEDHLGQLIKAL